MHLNNYMYPINNSSRALAKIILINFPLDLFYRVSNPRENDDHPTALNISTVD